MWNLEKNNRTVRKGRKSGWRQRHVQRREGIKLRNKGRRIKAREGVQLRERMDGRKHDTSN